MLCSVFSRSGFTDGYYTENLGKLLFGIRTRDDVIASSSAFPFLHSLYRAERQSVAVETTAEILKDNRMCLLYWPAAFKLHHAIRGGLLYHTLSIVRLAQKVCEIYTFVDKELLISGAILHDIAKLREFDVAETGIATGYSNEGNLLGHLTMGAMVIDRYAEKLGVDKKTAMLLEHMVLSHHGEPEFGAAVRPGFIEAELLSELDLMDSRIFEMREAVENAEVDGFSGKIWAMDNRKLFNHGREDITKETKLF